MIEWTYALKFRTVVSVFSGMAVAGLVDNMVVRNHERIPFIPGSSVKGRLRFFAERLLRSVNGDATASGLRIHPVGGPDCKIPDSACTICRLFGNSSIPSYIWVGDADLDPSLKPFFKTLLDSNRNSVVHPDIEVRPGIAISRKLRTALPNHLFFDEAVPSMTSFLGSILINGSLNETETRFLIASARLVDRIGSRKAVGRGILETGIEIGRIE